MILRSISAPSNAAEASEAKPASEVFIRTQKNVRPPYAIIFQAAHSKLAGDIASLLAPDLFGELPADVIRGIREHDCARGTNQSSMAGATGRWAT